MLRPLLWPLKTFQTPNVQFPIFTLVLIIQIVQEPHKSFSIPLVARYRQSASAAFDHMYERTYPKRLYPHVDIISYLHKSDFRTEVRLVYTAGYLPSRMLMSA